MASLEIRKHNRTVLNSLKKGDLVEFPRGAYSHWAVYIGDKKVIHLTIGEDERHSTSRNVTSCCCECSSKGLIRIDNFFDVAGKDKAKRNNSLDGKKEPLPPDQIVKNALSRLNEVGYSAVIKNCQHFATWCRYGEASSDQVQFWTSMTVLGAAGVLAAVGITAAVVGRNKSKKQTQ